MKKQKVIVICGPTASGKTALSIELAKKINGEIVSCDSMQIYKEMDIGTAKPTKEEMQEIPHYMINTIFPNERYSVADYKKDAKKAIREIIKKGKVPIIVGGTGLYVDSLIYEIEYPDIKFDEKYRQELEEQVRKDGLEKLYNKAKKRKESMTYHDKKRIIRVLEIYKATGKTKTEQERKSREKEPEFDYLVYGLNMPREKLYERINLRVDIMIKQGLIKEVEEIYKKYNEFPTAMQGLGYKEVVEYLEGHLTKEEMIEKIKQETRRYAKRQMTWFRKNKQTIWLDTENTKQNNLQIILEDLS